MTKIKKVDLRNKEKIVYFNYDFRRLKNRVDKVVKENKKRPGGQLRDD